MSLFESQVEYVGEKFAGLTCEASLIGDRQFYDCCFTDCSFSATKFRSCRFVDCTFEGCDLSSINFEGSTFSNTNFENSKLIGVNWTIASWSKPVLGSPIRFNKCVVDFSNFFGLSLHDIWFRESSVKDVEFSEADLTGGDFTNAILTKSRFSKSNLTRANFQGATEYSIDVTNNKITNARFSFPEAIALLQGLEIELAGMDLPRAPSDG